MRLATIRVSLKTSKAGLNTWIFRAGKDFKLTARERADSLYEVDSDYGGGQGEKLSNAVREAREKFESYVAHNEIAGDPRVQKTFVYLDEVIEYFKKQVGS